MSSKTKKQHYVPQCYLKAWQIPGKSQIHVYDKTSDAIRINRIEDIASERYFYDINPSDLLPEVIIAEMRKKGLIWSDEISQSIEQTFAKDVEKPLSGILKNIRGHALTASLGVNDCFITDKRKAEFSSYLAWQFVRTKRVRETISASSDCLTQALLDMGFPESDVNKYRLSEKESKILHIGLLLDTKHLATIAELFYRMTWILILNSSDTRYFTTDSPIVPYGHVKDPFFSTNGIASRGVEVFCPLSPYNLLIMLEPSYHSFWQKFDRRCIGVDDEHNVSFYNQLLAINAERSIFSVDGNFDLVHKMKDKDPNILRQPFIQLGWNNKDYYPQGK